MCVDRCGFVLVVVMVCKLAWPWRTTRARHEAILWGQGTKAPYTDNHRQDEQSMKFLMSAVDFAGP